MSRLVWLTSKRDSPAYVRVSSIGAPVKTNMCWNESMEMSGRSLGDLPKCCRGCENAPPSAVSNMNLSRQEKGQLKRRSATVSTC